VVRGFFADVVEQIGVPDVQELLMSAIEAELADSMVV
jgi:Fe-S cluster assembly protein SufD